MTKTMTDLAFTSAAELAFPIRNREVSPVDVMRATLARIAARSDFRSLRVARQGSRLLVRARANWPIARADRLGAGAMPDNESPPPSARNPDPAPTIPVPPTSRPAPGVGSTGPPWWCLGSWRRHWRTARRGTTRRRTTRRRTTRRRTTRRRTTRRRRHRLPAGDNGKSDDCKCRQDFSSMYHWPIL